ncbi:MAG: hypothetical protein QM594_18320, partial [Niabella sp.]
NYLTNTTRNMMFDPQNINERLGWSSVQSHKGFEQETGQLYWPYHNGANGNYRAILIQLPYHFTGVALTNSTMYLASESAGNNVSTNDYLVDVIMEAFYEATHSRPLTEVVRHGIPEKDYQADFNIIRKSGYYPVWVDGYDVAGKTFFNAIFRYNSNKYEVVARHHMSKEGYQREYNEWVKTKGYRLLHLDNYLYKRKIYYAAIFILRPGNAMTQPAYHAQTAKQHQALFEKYTEDGFVPVNVSVVSSGDKLSYSAFYEKKNVGGAVLKSILSQTEYQDKFEEMKKKKWEQVYINAYHHKGATRFSVIWYEKPGEVSYAAIRKSSEESYLKHYDTYTGKGLKTQCITGYDEGGKHWYAALWSE